MLNAFSDSSLVVIGNLRTRFFYGLDIWAEVGGRVEMDYGEGYCLPLGYRNAAREAQRPRHSARTFNRRRASGATRTRSGGQGPAAPAPAVCG